MAYLNPIFLEMVLATDMAEHFSQLNEIKNTLSSMNADKCTVAISIHDPLKSNDLLLTAWNFLPDGRSNLLLVSK